MKYVSKVIYWQAYQENQKLAYELSEATKLFVQTIAKQHGLITDTEPSSAHRPRTGNRKSITTTETTENQSSIGEFSDATWKKLVDLMTNDWELLTKDVTRPSSSTAAAGEVANDPNKAFENITMRHTINRELYLDIFGEDVGDEDAGSCGGNNSPPDLLRDGNKNYNAVLEDMAQSTRRKKLKLQKEVKQHIRYYLYFAFKSWCET